MVVECKRKLVKKTFEELEVGECFKCESAYFIKGLIYKNGEKVAVNLNTGVIFEPNDRDSIRSVSKAKVIIEE